MFSLQLSFISFWACVIAHFHGYIRNVSPTLNLLGCFLPTPRPAGTGFLKSAHLRGNSCSFTQQGFLAKAPLCLP